jgi:hypothetical protein
MSIPDPTYPDSQYSLRVRCTTCGEQVFGYSRGARDFRGILKHIKRHEEAYHPRYSKELIYQVEVLVEELNQELRVDGHVGRYHISRFALSGLNQ